MIYNFENLNFQILTIDKFKHEKGLFRAKERPFASISIRLKGMRLNKGTQLLIKGEKTVNEIAEECGFSDEKYFSRCIKKHFGVSPINLRQQN